MAKVFGAKLHDKKRHRVEMKVTRAGVGVPPSVFVWRGKCQPEPGKKKRGKITCARHCSFFRHLTTNHYVVIGID